MIPYISVDVRRRFGGSTVCPCPLLIAVCNQIPTTYLYKTTQMRYHYNYILLFNFILLTIIKTYIWMLQIYTLVCFLPNLCWFLDCLALYPWRCRWHVPQKHMLTMNGLFIHSSVVLQPFVGPWPVFQCCNLFYTDCTTHWTSDQPVARPLPTHRTTQTRNKRTHKHPCLWVGFEPTITASVERRSRGRCEGTILR
jgi:hypothetical protein